MVERGNTESVRHVICTFFVGVWTVETQKREKQLLTGSLHANFGIAMVHVIVP